MENIQLPEIFPKEETMILIIQKTISVSWKNELTLRDVQRWMNNFTGEVFPLEVEQRLALWMLCHYTFYNEVEINHLCKTIYTNLLHEIAEKNNLDYNQETPDVFSNIYFAAIGEAGESGGLLLYFFRQEADISIDRFCYPSDIPKGENNTLVFIDDVTLSGDTAANFFRQKLQDKQYKQAYYITLFASDEAIKKLSSYGITVLYCILLDDRDKCFSDNSIMFSSFPELRESAKKLAEVYGANLEPDMALGYKEGQYSFGFYYNTPNNSLPIFWSVNQWSPIFKRKEKIYRDDQRKSEFGIFI